jgi:DNA-binding HxlR family transcriptional regulator
VSREVSKLGVGPDSISEKKDKTPPMQKSVSASDCPVTLCLKVIGGKWKPVIVFLIKNKIDRFGVLQRALPKITKQMLTMQLRELELDGVIDRKIFAEVPPKVEYSITEFGETIFPVIHQMKEWGEFAMKSHSKAAKRLRSQQST